MNKVAYASQGRWLDRVPMILAVTASLIGITTIGLVLLNEGASHPPGSVFAAFSEIQDSPIEDLSDNRPGVIHRAHDGLFHARLVVNDRPLRCIVDTGASSTLLSMRDSRRLGLAETLRFNGRVHTAGGERQAAHGKLAEVELAGHSFRHVTAIVVRGAPTPCLLGQDLLARLDGAEIHGDTLVLR